MRTFLFILFLFGYTSGSYSQNIGIAEKAAINGMTLYKAWLQSTSNGGMLVASEPEFFDGFTACYFDDDGNLRKFITNWDYPESSSSTTNPANKTACADCEN
jgi:hypothetical protein